MKPTTRRSKPCVRTKSTMLGTGCPGITWVSSGTDFALASCIDRSLTETKRCAAASRSSSTSSMVAGKRDLLDADHVQLGSAPGGDVGRRSQGGESAGRAVIGGENFPEHR